MVAYKMRIVFIADFRSPIARNWISSFVDSEYEVHVISSFPCVPNDLKVSSLHVVPVAFSGIGRAKGEAPAQARTYFFNSMRNIGNVTQLYRKIRHWMGPFDVFRRSKHVSQLIESIQPDIVHAMRVPFEGMLATEALRYSDLPLIVSVWGNDFTLFARRSPLIGWMTRRAMSRADAIHPDCHRDLRLAHQWGLAPNKPAAVLPGNGGIRTDLFYPGPANKTFSGQWSLPKGSPVVLNARGFRGYVCNDAFFQSIPLVLAHRPDVIFLGLAMQDNPVAEKWIQKLDIASSVRLLPPVNRYTVAQLFRFADISVSPSKHDGTPNTLLESMACGCFPVAGNIESVREWIEHGVNGLLCDPTNPKALAESILQALFDSNLREHASNYNVRLIAERAEYKEVMKKAEAFYLHVLNTKR